MGNDQFDVHNGDELSHRERRMVEVLGSYLVAPESLSRPEFLAEHPSLADELACFLDDQDEVLNLTKPFQDTELGVADGIISGDAELPASDHQATARHNTGGKG